MRIAQIAPLHECVPPKLYGGTERVVSFLTEEPARGMTLRFLPAATPKHRPGLFVAVISPCA